MVIGWKRQWELGTWASVGFPSVRVCVILCVFIGFNTWGLRDGMEWNGIWRRRMYTLLLSNRVFLFLFF